MSKSQERKRVCDRKSGPNTGITASPLKSPLHKLRKPLTKSELTLKNLNRPVFESKKSFDKDKDKMDQIMAELKKISEGQERMEATQQQILNRVSEVENDLSSLKDDINSMKIEQNTTKKVEDIQNEFSSVKFELNRLEQYSRKSSIRVYGIEESQDKKVGEKALSKIKEEINVEISPDDVDIVHRVGKRSEERPKGILVKFSSHKPKERVMKSKNMPKI